MLSILLSGEVFISGIGVDKLDYKINVYLLKVDEMLYKLNDMFIIKEFM